MAAIVAEKQNDDGVRRHNRRRYCPCHHPWFEPCEKNTFTARVVRNYRNSPRMTERPRGAQHETGAVQCYRRRAFNPTASRTQTCNIRIFRAGLSLAKLLKTPLLSNVEPKFHILHRHCYTMLWPDRHEPHSSEPSLQRSARHQFPSNRLYVYQVLSNDAYWR